MSYSGKFIGNVLEFVKEMEKELDHLKEKMEDAWEIENKLNSLLYKKDEEIKELQKENARLKTTSLADKEVLKKTLELMKEVEDKTSLNVLVSKANIFDISDLEPEPRLDYVNSDENVIKKSNKEETIVKPLDNKIDIEINKKRELKISMYA